MGERLIVHTPGGGGHGRPFERDTADVARDVMQGLVSPEQARELYGVVVGEDGIDQIETARCRHGLI